MEIIDGKSVKKEIDIRNFMEYDQLCKLLINNPTEMALLEIVCILINNNINKKYTFKDDN